MVNAIESGTVSLTGSIGDGVSGNISFTESFEKTPVVMVYMPTYNGGNSVGVRARNVTTSGAEIFYEENEGHNASHTGEDLHWVAFAQGTYTINGVSFEVGIHTTSTVLNTNSSSGPGVGDNITFSTSWGSAPVVLHTLNTYANSAFKESNANGVSTTDFYLAQEEGTDTGAADATEDIGWVAIEDVGASTIDGVSIDATYSAGDGSNDGVDDTSQSNSFAQSFGSTPAIISKQQTRNGGEGAWARGDGSFGTGSFGVYAEEDSTEEQGHASEDFGWFAIPPNSTVEPVPAQPSAVSATVKANDSLDLTWNDNGRFEDNFRVHISRDGATYTGPSGGPTAPGTNSTSANYNPNSDNSYGSQIGVDSSFKFRVRAENSNGNSGWAYSGTVYTDPLPPHNVSIQKPDTDTIRITGTIKSDLADYIRVQYREDTGDGYGSWTWFDNNFPSNTKGSSFTFTYKVGTAYQSGDVLKRNARYQFRIRTQNNNGSSDVWSKWVYPSSTTVETFIFGDTFEDQDLAEWDTTSLSDGQSGIQSGSVGSMGISGADEGSYYCRLDANDYIRESLGDLSGETDVVVHAAVAAGSEDSSGEFFDIRWYDGANWQDLKTYGWAYNKQGWVEMTAVVPDSWLATDNRVQFGGDSGGGGDYQAVDRVEVKTLGHEYPSFTPPQASATGTGTSTADVTWADRDPFADGSWTVYRSTDDSRGTSQTSVSAQNAFRYYVESAGYNAGNYCELWVDGTNHSLNNRGMNTVLVRGGAFVEANSYDTHGSTTASDNLESYIKGLNKGDVLFIGVKDAATSNLTSTCRNTIESRLQSNRIQVIGHRESWGIIATIDVENHNENHQAQYRHPAKAGHAPVTYDDTNLTHDTTYAYSVQRTLDGVKALSAPARAITDADSSTVDQTTLRIDETRSVAGVTDDGLGDHSGAWEHGYRYGDLDRGLIAYWKLNEGSGDIARDHALNQYGQLNGPTWTTDSAAGNYALSFDGSGDNIELPSNALPPTDQLTLSLWTKGGSSQPQNDTIIEARDSGGNRVLNVHLPWGNENVYWDFGDDPDDRVSVDLTGTNWQTWNHWTFVVDANEPRMAIYMNGTLQKENSQGKALTSPPGLFKIGSYTDGSREYDGIVENVRLYDRLLSEPEITALSNRTI